MADDNAQDRDAPVSGELGIEGFEFFDLPEPAAPAEAADVSGEEDERQGSDSSEAGEDVAEPAKEPDLAQRLADLEARYAREAAEYRATIDRLTQGLSIRREASSEEEPEIEFPDILEDPKGYAAAMRQMIRNETSGALRKSTAGATREERINAAVTKFYAENDDLQQVPEFVNAAYEAEARHYSALGVDIQDALLRDPDGVSKRVAAAARDRAVALGIALRRKADETETEEPDGRPAGFGARGRTAGVSGRSVGRAARNGAANAGPGDFAAELRGEQAKSGFF